MWDWLQLLGVPVFLACATIGFGLVQFYLADQQHGSDQQNALDQQRATTLQTYIDNIQELLLKDNLFGNNSVPKTDADKVTIQEVRELARARTLTALQGLDPERKGRLVQFLYEAKLIGYYDHTGIQKPIIDLRDANLINVRLDGAVLTGADLSVADLTGSSLVRTYLYGTKLVATSLTGADLTGASLAEADLTEADLTESNLVNTDLTNTDLRGADLTRANLGGANLGGSKLNRSKLTQQQLDQVYSCGGATLPQALICHHTPPSTPTPSPL